MVQNVLDKIHCLRDQQNQESDTFRALPERGDRLERILFHADVLWLGMDSTLSSATHRRQVIAAQLHYLDDVPIDEIIELLAPSSGEARLGRSTVEDWLRQECVIRALAYNELFFTNCRLIDRMDNLVARLTPVLGSDQMGRILMAPGLWQRLTFQYHYLENLAVQDICQRLQAAAQREGYAITVCKLNAWLRDKLLVKHLLRSIA